MEGQIEVCLQDDSRKQQHTFNGGNEEKGLYPLSVSFTVKEDIVDDGVHQASEEEIAHNQCQENGYQVVLGLKDKGVAKTVEGIEVEQQRQHDAGQQHQEALETQLVGCFHHLRRSFTMQVEEALGLPDDESAGVGEGDDGHDETGEQQRRDDVVAVDAVGNRVAGNSG